MKNIISLTGLLLSAGAVNAAIVTFPEETCPSFPCHQVMSNEGYLFDAIDAPHLVTTTAGRVSMVWDATSPPNPPTIEITHGGDFYFGLSSLDLFITENYGEGDDNPFYNPYRIAAYDSSDQLIAELKIYGGAEGEWRTLVFGNEWQNVSSVIIFDSSYCCPIGNTALGEMEIENIDLAVVPVPAAVWLYGSALAGLGWLRRKPMVY